MNRPALEALRARLGQRNVGGRVREDEILEVLDALLAPDAPADPVPGLISGGVLSILPSVYDAPPEPSRLQRLRQDAGNRPHESFSAWVARGQPQPTSAWCPCSLCVPAENWSA